jgi:hypothetical protein
MINPSGFIDSHEGPPGEQLAEHLARHGATVVSVRIENVAHGTIADRLQAEALALGADMIVGGAFGHPRLWEKMLGGVTRDLMARMNYPCLCLTKLADEDSRSPRVNGSSQGLRNKSKATSDTSSIAAQRCQNLIWHG